MEKRGIIIADRDNDQRKQVADYFEKAGYQVETSDSATHVLCSILEKHTPVVLLGSDFDNKISSVDLIHLLKKCNKHLDIIVVSDDLPLNLARKIRQEGIFYHALKSDLPGDQAELGQAVQCAFDKRESCDRGQEMELAITETVDIPEAEELPALKATPMEIPATRFLNLIERHLDKTRLVLGTLTMCCFATYLYFVASAHITGSGNFAIWLFMGFCSLIVVGQLIPIFSTRWSLHRVGSMQTVTGANKKHAEQGEHNDTTDSD